MNKEKRDILKNLWDFYSEIAVLCGYDRGRHSGTGYAWNRNGSWPAFLFGKPDIKQAEVISREIKERQLPPFWIMDDEEDRGLIEYLDTQGIRTIRKWKGMVLNTKSYVPAGQPDGKELTFNAPAGQPDRTELTFNAPADLPSWRALINEGLLSSNHMGQEVEQALKTAGCFDWVVARVNRTPVATGLLYTFERVAGIYMIVTKKSHRGMGIGSLVTASLIQRALENGTDRIILHATPMGEGIYRNVGFEPVNELSIYWMLGY